jgi:hypothetical protein
MKVAYAFEMPETLLTSTRYTDPEAESTSVWKLWSWLRNATTICPLPVLCVLYAKWAPIGEVMPVLQHVSLPKPLNCLYWVKWATLIFVERINVGSYLIYS